MIRRGVAVSLAVVAATGGTGAALAHLSGNAPADPADRPIAVVPSVDAQQAAAFGVLRGDSGEAAELPPAAADVVERRLGQDVGASAALARRAGGAADGEALFVVPGRGWVCLVKGGGAAGCNRTSDVAAGYGLLLESDGDGAVLAGMVPDGVSDIEVSGAGRRMRAVAQANVWSARVDFSPETVRWTGRDGIAHEVPVATAPA